MPESAITAILDELGEQLRQAFRIDGTMGDAQDFPHPFVGTTYCLACGLAKSYRIHDGGGKVAAEMRQRISIGPVERYCVDSGRPVKVEGDRCIRHGDQPVMCTTAVRTARCVHPRLSPNHPYPHCSECGRDVPEGEAP